MGAEESKTLFMNFSFWTLLIAALALVLSQLPPIRILFRRTRLQIEPYNRLGLSHWLGNPNINLHLVITNIGGRKVSISSLKLFFEFEDGNKFSLPAQSFSIPGATQGSFIFTRFTLYPDAEWSNFVGFYPNVDSTDERLSKQLVKDLRKDINQKIVIRQKTAPENKENIEAAEEFVTPLKEFFGRHNRWRAGEYQAQLKVKCDPDSASTSRKFRFTLFESDIQDLTELIAKYKYGIGVYWNDNEASTVEPKIKDLV